MNCENKKANTCCFFGHRKIRLTPLLSEELYKIAEGLVLNGVNTFLFGSKSEFDRVCHAVITELKEKYPHISRIYVRAEYRHIDEKYKKYLLRHYEDTYYSEGSVNAGKGVYIKRNYDMIDASKVCVVYYDENYKPPRRKNSSADVTDYQPGSGTKIAYEYAKRRGLCIINVFKP